MLKYLLLGFFPLLSYAQVECTPYYNPPSYEVNQDVVYSASYVSCFHTQAVMLEAGTNSFRLTSTMSGKHHNNDAYLSPRYYYNFNSGNISIGPLYRLNNNPGFGIAQLGSDIRLFSRYSLTSNLFQINSNLNYLFIGLKVNF